MDLVFYNNLNPVAWDFGFFQVRWYGLMYVLAFVLAYFLILRLIEIRKEKLSQDEAIDFLTYCILGVLVGGRLGYAIFYGGADYFFQPWKILEIWNGGMSFHGGLIGVIVAGFIFSRQKNISFLRLSEILIPAVPLGLFFGRIGNFVNGELWGRVTNGNWGVIFPGMDLLPRYPSQLFEAFFEGLVIFGILWFFVLKKRENLKPGFSLGVFLLLYGLFRFAMEYFREPDFQLGFLAFGLTMGQWLCLPMAVAGAVLLFFVLKK